MKNSKTKGKALFASLLSLFLLASCSPSSSSGGTDSSSPGTLPSDVDDGLILHCFDWTFKQIEDNLDAIAASGFRAVQTSPVTQPKDGGSIWYYFYQPCSYSIATSSPLGGKTELTSLCEAAEERGIAVLVDIVFNHMATTGGTNADGTPDIDPEVNTYEPYIYEHREELFHHSVSAAEITQCYPGLPDLNTAHPYIQERSLSLLKECIDCGVDGFRFDAAKHIETPDDETYASDFWTNTLGEAKKYYLEKTGNELFAYGEILGAPGNNRPISNYTKLMKVTDSDYSGNTGKSLITNRAAIGAANTRLSYPAESAITWAESHDTVLHDETNWTFDNLVKIWSLLAARKDTQSLFFARPDTDDDTCTVGKIGSYDWNSPYFAAANKFHNDFIGAEEYINSQSSFYINERYDDEDNGAVIIDVRSVGEATITFSHIPDGTYYDQLSGTQVVISGGSASLSFPSGNKGVIILAEEAPESVLPPILTVSRESGTYSDPFTLELTLENATDATITIDNGNPIHWNDSYEMTIGDDETGTTNISIWYTNGASEGTKELTFTKIALVEGYFNILNLDPSCLSDYELYVWSWYPNLWSKPYTLDETTGNLLIPNETLASCDGFLLALFPDGHEIADTASWDSACLKQTSDINPDAGYFDASDFHL